MKTRKIKVDRKYLLLPVARDGGWFLPADKVQILGVYQGGELIEEYELILDKSPRCWSFMYLDAYKGKELELQLEGGDEDILDLLEVSDMIRDSDIIYREPERPFAHFTPMHGFMNDPNGLFYHRGEYHYFAQLNPYGFGAGNTHWMHAVSSDLIHWQELPYALLPDETGRMYSGSGIVDIDNISGMGKNGEPPIFLFYTAAGSKSRWSRGRYFEIATAISTDGGNSFVKYANNPVVPFITFMNRDPKVVWEPEGKNFVMVVFLDNDRYMLLYSKDLLHWEQGETITIRGAAECPDLFCLPLDEDPSQMKWVLWGCSDNYIIGHFEARRFVAETEAIEGHVHKIYSAHSIFARSPGGYAAQTFTGLPGGRVVQLSWIHTHLTHGSFSGCASVPNELKLVSKKQGPRVLIWPVKELERLYQENFSFKNRGLEEIERIPPQYLGEAMDMTFRFSIKPDKIIAVSVRGVLMVYDPRLCQLILPTGSYDIGEVGDILELRVITDRCSVEIYVNGGQFQTAIATVPDPANITVKPVYLDAGIGLDFEIHKLGNMWQPSHCC